MSKFPSSCSTKLSSLGYLTVFVAFSPQILEVWSLLLWKFGLGSYVRSKFHWPLAPRSPVPWIKTSCCVESSKHCAWRRVVLMILHSAMFWSTEPRIAAPKANETLMSHSFQDQTFTAKVITPPKSMYKLGLNGLCHMPGQFYEGRSGKFRHVYPWLNFS